MTQLVLSIALYAIPTILAITLHEAAHGYAARLLGDNTAYNFGRLSLNPLVHIDPVGTFLVPGLLLLGSIVSGTSGILFGWAKPVPVNFARLKNPKRDMVWVSLAGPVSNLFQAVLWALLLKVLFFFYADSVLFSFIAELCIAGINVNLILMAFNLIPIPPLDGGRIVTGLLPMNMAVAYARIENYGLFIMVALIATGMTTFLIRPFMQIGRFFIGLIF